ncbi:hypothetical protein AAG906_034162 [Vitis piasezkii]
MALSSVSPLYISKSPNHLRSLSKPFTVVCRIERQRENNWRGEANAESKKWQRLVSTALAAAVVTLSPVMPAVADLNKYEVETRGEFGIGSAAQFGSADLRKAVHVNENFRRANFTSADMRESDFSGSTFNGEYLEKAVAYKASLTGPDAPHARPYKMVLHPSTGLCVLRGSLSEPLKLGPCTESEAWGYTPQKILIIKGTYLCLQAVGLGKPAKLSVICSNPGSNWEIISDSKMYLSTKLGDGTTVCLDVDSSDDIVTNSCKCLSRDDMRDPGSQWFKIANSTDISSKPILRLAPTLNDGLHQREDE